MSPSNNFKPTRHSKAPALLDKYNSGHGWFITHVDRTPVRDKVIAFLPNFCINAVLSFVLLWRIFHVARYTALVPGDYLPKPDVIPGTLTLLGNLVLDVLLYLFIWPTTKVYLTRHLWLRIRYGFREKEIVFRKPVGWRRQLLSNMPPEQAETHFQTSVFRAIDPRLVFKKPGDNTISDFWVLDYQAPLGAYQALTDGSIDETAWELSVWQKQKGEDWAVWEVWRIHDPESNRCAGEAFKQRLLSMGKEDLFHRWQKVLADGLVSVDGGQQAITPEDTDKVSVMFKEEGIDFSKLWGQVFSSMEF